VPEGLKGQNLCNRGMLVHPAAFQLAQGKFRQLFLSFIRVENNRAVLGSDVAALAVGCCGIVGAPENLQDGLSGEEAFIVAYFNNFGMTCFPTAHLFVAGVFGMAAGITASSGEYALDAVVDSFDAPEASAPHDDFLSHAVF